MIEILFSILVGLFIVLCSICLIYCSYRAGYNKGIEDCDQVSALLEGFQAGYRRAQGYQPTKGNLGEPPNTKGIHNQ
jgi:hypothetical protein